jgi:hypothetical protein
LLLEPIELFHELVYLVPFAGRQQRAKCYPDRKITDQSTNEIMEIPSRTLCITGKFDNKIGCIFHKWHHVFYGLLELCEASKLLYVLDVAEGTGHVFRKIQYELVTLLLILQSLQRKIMKAS